MLANVQTRMVRLQAWNSWRGGVGIFQLAASGTAHILPLHTECLVMHKLSPVLCWREGVGHLTGYNANRVVFEFACTTQTLAFFFVAPIC